MLGLELVKRGGIYSMYLMLSAVGASIITYTVMPLFLELLRKGGAVCQNYQGMAIPVGGGFLFLWVGCLSLLLLGAPVWTFPGASPALRSAHSFVPLIIGVGLGFGLLGLFDDLMGSRRESGLKGHGGALLQGQLTSGAIKALLGVGLGVLLALYRKSGETSLSASWLLTATADGFLIAGTANLLNLLDLRPGRAGKSFLLGSLLVIALGNPMSLLLLPWIGSLIGYLPYDLKGQAMMGDTGANALGAILGLVSSYALTLWIRLFLLVGVLAIHVLAERVSLSKIIDESPPLKALDHWGRPNP